MPSAASGTTATRAPCTGHPTHTPLPAPATVSGGSSAVGGLDLFQADVGDRQRLGHPVRGMQRGPGQQPLHLCQQRFRDGRAGREQQLRCRPELYALLRSRPSRVARTLRSAAGEAKTTVASIAAAAPASARAVRVRGAVTSMAGVTDTAPSAGPSRANGAKPATSRAPGRIPKVAATVSRIAASCRWV